MSSTARIRLHVDAALGAGQSVLLDRDPANYLFNVMRLGIGDSVLLFNGRDGEWQADVAEAGKRRGVLVCARQTRDQALPPDVWLLFAPIKKARTDFIVEKAAEMGCRRILPVLTDFTNAERVRTDRLQAHAVEAAEQCGGVFVPEVAAPVKLDRLLADWDGARAMMFCDEALAGEDGRLGGAPGPWAVLIGPEGGFSERERQTLRAHNAAWPVSLGPRILRADTAAVAALTLWQMTHGDWQ